MPSPPLNERRRRRNLWDGLLRLIMENDGWIVSPNQAWPIVMETLNHELPEALVEHGWLVHDAGSAERFMPEPQIVRDLSGKRLVRDALVPVTVKVYRVTLPP